MSDHSDPEPGDDEGTDGEKTDVERTVTREEAATVLHDLADGVASGSVAFEDGDVTAVVPEAVEFELEYEREGDEAEIEVELEWDVDASVETDEEGVETDREESATETGGDESAAATGEHESVAETEPGDAAASGDAAAVAGLVEPGEAARSRARFELYRDSAGEWRWRLAHHNGNVIADGGEGYNRKGGARKGLESVRRNAPGAAVAERE